MPRSYAKSLKEYDKPFELDTARIVEAMKRHGGRKRPTSIALDDTTVKELKVLAEKLDLPYQVLMRILILDGLKRLKKAA